ncbi:hypothetical protein Mapa_012546 [Marchantia paleacea]|nr:hypothetical protein Mapa_012546 [Marchantia paleacea]
MPIIRSHDKKLTSQSGRTSNRTRVCSVNDQQDMTQTMGIPQRTRFIMRTRNRIRLDSRST